MATDEDVFDLTTHNRRRTAALLGGLAEDQWQAPTLCEGWSVHVLAGHLLQPMLVGFGRFFLTALRHRGDTDATVDALARRLARRPPDQLVELLGQHAADRVAPPRVGAMGPFADSCIHLRDIARPLAIALDVPPDHWKLLLDHLTGPRPPAALVPRGRLDGLALAATDRDWGAGTGREVRGSVEALAMAVTGRRVALDDLSGDGVDLLRRRLDEVGRRDRPDGAVPR